MGNPLFDGTYTYTWDRGRQLVGVTGPDFVATYKYNAAGQRISKTVNGVTTHFTYAGDQLIRQSDGTAGGTIHFYYDANGELIGAWPENSQTYTYLRNAQGDIVGHIDNRSTSRYNYAYDAWGNHTLEDNNYFIKGNPFRYRGYYYDEETGFYFCQSRYYNPEWR
ncbi:MAG: RHS repeat-associated core domain-containing protein, partial [Oscillospiraceae bacterium]|nr:RHS repeat-associated core domain-containing protein [Oscillospiraceae bacterium]